MNLEEFRLLAEMAQSVSVSGLLLYLMFYFRNQAERSTERYIEHLEKHSEDDK